MPARNVLKPCQQFEQISLKIQYSITHSILVFLAWEFGEFGIPSLYPKHR